MFLLETRDILVVVSFVYSNMRPCLQYYLTLMPSRLEKTFCKRGLVAIEDLSKRFIDVLYMFDSACIRIHPTRGPTRGEWTSNRTGAFSRFSIIQNNP